MTPTTGGQMNPDAIDGGAIVPLLLLLGLCVLASLGLLARCILRRTRATFAHAVTPGRHGYRTSTGAVWLQTLDGRYDLAGSTDPAMHGWTRDAVQFAHGRLTRITTPKDDTP